MNMSVPINHLQTVNGVELFVKRDDLIHDFVSGNKLYKLKYNIESAIQNNHRQVLTFGGAYSNHIAATAAYCQEKGLSSIGIIRGEQTIPQNPTLAFAESCGMQLSYIDRSTYRLKNDPEFLEKLEAEYDNPFIIPEGGSNCNGIKGAKEIINQDCSEFDVVAVAMGTGTTFAGILKALAPHQKLIGIPVHKHASVFEDVMLLDSSLAEIPLNNYSIKSEYHFGGYAKWTDQLLQFMRNIYDQFDLKTDPIYTSKALFGVTDLIENGHIEKGTKVLFIHTGGLQGIQGFEERHQIAIYSN